VTAIRIGRSRADRINGSPAVVVERLEGQRVIISTVAQPSLTGAASRGAVGSRKDTGSARSAL